jgi:hypothetical protein
MKEGGSMVNEGAKKPIIRRSRGIIYRSNALDKRLKIK